MTILTRGVRQRAAGPSLAIYAGATTAVAALGSLATAGNVDGWYADAAKPWFTPPNWVFGPTWTSLYVAMALAVWLAWRQGGPTGPWWVQLALNLAWTPTFFALEQPWLAFGVILALDVAVLITLIAFSGFSRAAAWLMAPYLGWVLFATALNLGVAILN